MLHLGRLWPLLTNIRLGWESLSGTNPLVHCEHSLIRDINSFIRIGSGGFYSTLMTLVGLDHKSLLTQKLELVLQL